ncbi:MAG: phosphate ABC transporter substrate-binding protein [Planctomycetota bacterium]|jgi:ABC-type phosphate transport system substrate-binding protein|nr:phosphate ABC transporter substrate-binding protein [Planctomycetota bacterium]
MTRMIQSILIITALCCTSQAAAEVAVVANTSATSVSANDLKGFYLGKKRSWDDGTRVNLTTNGSAIHDAFLDASIGKNASSFASFWKRIVFTGKGKLPEALADDAAVVAYVAANPGAIGYIDAGSAAEGVTKLTIE